MTLKEYAKLAQRTSNTKDWHDKVENGLLGLVGETGELIDLWKKHKYQGHPLSLEAMQEEAGDVCWYMVELLEGLGLDLEDTLAKNVEKLRRRYPEGFDADRSINREV